MNTAADREYWVKMFLFISLLSAGVVGMLHSMLFSEGVEQYVTLHRYLMTTAPFRYRLLAYGLPDVLNNAVGVPLHWAYTLNRFVWTASGTLLLAILLGGWFGRRWALAGCLIHLAIVPIGYFQGYLQPSDAPLFTLFLLGLLILDSGASSLLLLPVVLVGVFFHETIFWLVILTAIHALRTGHMAHWLPIIGAMGLIVVGVFAGLRQLEPSPNEFGYFILFQNMSTHWSYINTAAVLSPLVLLSKRTYPRLPSLAQSGLLMIPVMIIVVWITAFVQEARLFLLATPFLAALSIAWMQMQPSAQDEFRKEQHEQ